MDSLVVGTTTNRAEAIEALHRWGPTTFVNGEDVWYFTNLHSRGSAAEALVITNARIIALHPRSGAGFRAMHAELASVHAEDTRGRVRVVTAHGFTYTFKGLTTADVAAVSHYLDYGRQRRPDQAVTAQIVAQVTAPRPTPATPLPVDQPLPPPARPEVVESEPPGTSVPAHHIQMAAPQIAAALLRASAEQAVLYGRNVDVVKAEVVLSKWARAELLPGEFLWLFVKCKSSRPTADVLVITNARIIALDSSLGITFMVAHSQSGKPHADLASSRLTLMTATGWWLTAKSMDTDDISAVIFCVEHAHEHPAPYQVRVGAE